MEDGVVDWLGGMSLMEYQVRAGFDSGLGVAWLDGGGCVVCCVRCCPPHSRTALQVCCIPLGRAKTLSTQTAGVGELLPGDNMPGDQLLPWDAFTPNRALQCGDEHAPLRLQPHTSMAMPLRCRSEANAG